MSNSSEEEPYYITEIKRAQNFVNSGYTEPESEEDYCDYFRAPCEWLFLVNRMLGSEGPIIIDLNIVKHSRGLYDEKELQEMYPNIKDSDDLVVIGKYDKFITLEDINYFFETILNKTWPKGRSYYLNGIYNPFEYKWVKSRSPECGWFVEWDS